MIKPKASSRLALPLAIVFFFCLSTDGFAGNLQKTELKQLKQAISALERQLQSQRQEKPLGYAI